MKPDWDKVGYSPLYDYILSVFVSCLCWSNAGLNFCIFVVPGIPHSQQYFPMGQRLSLPSSCSGKFGLCCFPFKHFEGNRWPEIFCFQQSLWLCLPAEIVFKRSNGRPSFWANLRKGLRSFRPCKGAVL